METYVALLYSIILDSERRVVMADLRAMAGRLGFASPRTVAATGNLIFEAQQASISELEKRLEAGFREQFGRHVDMLARDADGWRRLAAGNPFAKEAQADGSRVIVRVMREPLAADVVERLAPYLTRGERVAVVDGDLWVHFTGQPSLSKLVPALTAKRLGIGTMRNWNTVARIAGLLDAAPA